MRLKYFLCIFCLSMIFTVIMTGCSDNTDVDCCVTYEDVEEYMGENGMNIIEDNEDS